MDGIKNLGKTKDNINVGKGQSDLEDYLKEAAQKLNREIAYEQHPEAGSYYRSDHFNFAKVGIPALYTASGVDVEGKGKEYGLQKDDEYTEKNYHRPSDEYNSDWNLEGGIEDLKLLFLVGKRIATEEKWPQWKEGSEFKVIREKSLENKVAIK
jgi:Zn-dependent M28 family amino/carboxypeptidase